MVLLIATRQVIPQGAPYEVKCIGFSLCMFITFLYSTRYGLLYNHSVHNSFPALQTGV